MDTIDNRCNPRLIGGSQAIRTIKDDIDTAARSDAKVLITGETGVGKDVIARLIHRKSARQLAPLAIVNCAGLPDSLLESELFGHVRGSFTGAFRDKPGLLEAAPNGTVFLDEVGEMSPRMQAVLLRFLDTGELQRVGAERPHTRVNVRLLAATNRDLGGLIADGLFRQDLYYRLNVIRLYVPPLRARREDIPALADHFLHIYVREHRTPPLTLSPAVMDQLIAYDWPGNIRQLRNVIERLVLTADGPMIEPGGLPADMRRALSCSGVPVASGSGSVATSAA
jgi:transcriptional regulator with GAF, ATPase, and Fis domain